MLSHPADEIERPGMNAAKCAVGMKPPRQTFDAMLDGAMRESVCPGNMRVTFTGKDGTQECNGLAGPDVRHFSNTKKLRTIMFVDPAANFHVEMHLKMADFDRRKILQAIPGQ
jgi:hypothetical protein